MFFPIGGELKLQGVPKSNPTWCLFYRVDRVDPALGQVDGLDQGGPFRAWINTWDSSLPFSLCNSSRTIKAAVCHIGVPGADFACGQLLEPLSSCCCIQTGSQEEELRKGFSFFSLKNCLLFWFYIAKASYWMLGNKMIE